MATRSPYPCREAEAIEDMTLIIKSVVSRSDHSPRKQHMKTESPHCVTPGKSKI